MSRAARIPLIVDVAVIGGGALGAATAWVLARRGVPVALLEEGSARQVRESVRGTAWSDHPGWDGADTVTPGALRTAAVGLWRTLEAETGATLLRRTDVLEHGRCRPGTGTLTPAEAASCWIGSFTGPVARHRGAGLQVPAGQAVAALTAAAAGHGAVLRHRCGPVTTTVVGDRVEIATAAGAVHARRAVVTTVEQHAAGTGEEVHLAPARPGLPLVAHHHPELGLVRIAPCAGGHVALSAPGVGAERLREYARAWLPGAGSGSAQAVAPAARSTGGAHVQVDVAGPVLAVRTDAVGSVAAPAWGRVLADAVTILDAAPSARTRLAS